MRFGCKGNTTGSSCMRCGESLRQRKNTRKRCSGIVHAYDLCMLTISVSVLVKTMLSVLWLKKRNHRKEILG